MAFSPGQFITAQRINRLQPKPFWAAANSTVAASATNADVPGCTMSITVETAGATAVFSWSTVWYYTGLPSNLSSSRVLWDVNASPILAINQDSASGDKGQGSQHWLTTIGTAGTYTFKMQTTTSTNQAAQIYSSMLVTIYEVV
jgi:hypothetical protein